MKRASTSKLAALFEELKTKRDSGCDITPEFLRQEYGLPTGGVSCFLYMLDQDKFHPELQKLIHQSELAPLVGKNEATQPMIKFLVEMPPYKQNYPYFEDELSAKELAIFFAMNVVRRASYEEFRQLTIRIYVEIANKMAEWRLDILEALNHGDKDFFGGMFLEKPEDEIRSHLKTIGLNPKQITAVFKMMHSK